MNVIITGCDGQAGSELQNTAPANYYIIPFNRGQLDITNLDQLRTCVDKIKPDLIINAAAFTDVEGAESNEADAFAVNAEGVKNLVTVTERLKTRIIHISTDYVFDGKSSIPYKPSDPTNPVSIYGKSKLDGERQLFANGRDRSLILRTGWVYSRFGNNFVKTMLRLMNTKPELSVISDQVGTPCWARTLAETIWQFAAVNRFGGIFHWADGGVASWYDFSVAIMEEALDSGILTKSIPIIPIAATAYPTKAQRPMYSVLDKSSTWEILGKTSRHWRIVLRQMLKDMAANHE